ncbi:hypothetical protein AK51_29625 [Serratia nematodiphila DZ0503SBS1]|nr:hypothetical protein AK51_29625 [Serratia nematodiphila DZ0503SBS1]
MLQIDAERDIAGGAGVPGMRMAERNVAASQQEVFAERLSTRLMAQRKAGRVPRHHVRFSSAMACARAWFSPPTDAAIPERRRSGGGRPAR